MSELQEAGAVDPAAREELIADLKQTDPSRWPLVIQEFRAAAAYRRRAEERAAKEKQESKSPEVSGGARAARVPRDEDPPDRYNEHAARYDDISKPRAEHDEYAKPLSNPPALATTGSRLTLSAEPALLNVSASRLSTASSLLDKPGEATTISIEPPPLAIRLAASHGDDAAKDNDSPFPPAKGRSEVKQASAAASISPRATPKQQGELSALSAISTGDRTGEQAAVPLTPADWQTHLAAAIRSMESASTAGASGENDIALQARLRMLYLLAGRRDDAMRPLPSAPRSTQEYWTSQIYGLSTWMDSERTPDPARRAAETKRILGEAVNQLGDTAPLAVRNLTFCTAVRCYGSFDAVTSAEFTPGQKVLLYAEVENFRTESSPKGFHTAVKFNWQIFDANGHRVGDYTSAANEETSLTPKHEFFLTKWFFLPTAMSSGKYTLQFTVEDALGHKVGQSTTEFAIK